MSLENFIVTVFCLVDDLLNRIVSETGKLRQRGFGSQLDDAEVITMEIVGEYQGIDTDAGILRYFGQHWRHYRRRSDAAVPSQKVQPEPAIPR